MSNWNSNKISDSSMAIIVSLISITVTLWYIEQFEAGIFGKVRPIPIPLTTDLDFKITGTARYGLNFKFTCNHEMLLLKSTE